MKRQRNTQQMQEHGKHPQNQTNEEEIIESNDTKDSIKS